MPPFPAGVAVGRKDRRACAVNMMPIIAGATARWWCRQPSDRGSLPQIEQFLKMCSRLFPAQRGARPTSCTFAIINHRLRASNIRLRSERRRASADRPTADRWKRLENRLPTCTPHPNPVGQSPLPAQAISSAGCGCLMTSSPASTLRARGGPGAGKQRSWGKRSASTPLGPPPPMPRIVPVPACGRESGGEIPLGDRRGLPPAVRNAGSSPTPACGSAAGPPLWASFAVSRGRAAAIAVPAGGGPRLSSPLPGRR